MDTEATNKDEEQLQNDVINVLRAFRMADTNDLELLTTTIERPEAVTIDEATPLVHQAAQTLMDLIHQYGLEQRKEAEQLAQIDGALWALKDLHNQGSVTGLTYTESVKRLYERKEAITALQAKETK